MKTITLLTRVFFILLVGGIFCSRCQRVNQVVTGLNSKAALPTISPYVSETVHLRFAVRHLLGGASDFEQKLTLSVSPIFDRNARVDDLQIIVVSGLRSTTGGATQLIESKPLLTNRVALKLRWNGNNAKKQIVVVDLRDAAHGNSYVSTVLSLSGQGNQSNITTAELGVSARIAGRLIAINGSRILDRHNAPYFMSLIADVEAVVDDIMIHLIPFKSPEQARKHWIDILDLIEMLFADRLDRDAELKKKLHTKIDAVFKHYRGDSGHGAPLTSFLKWGHDSLRTDNKRWLGLGKKFLSKEVNDAFVKRLDTMSPLPHEPATGISTPVVTAKKMHVVASEVLVSGRCSPMTLRLQDANGVDNAVHDRILFDLSSRQESLFYKDDACLKAVSQIEIAKDVGTQGFFIRPLDGHDVVMKVAADVAMRDKGLSDKEFTFTVKNNGVATHIVVDIPQSVSLSVCQELTIRLRDDFNNEISGYKKLNGSVSSAPGVFFFHDRDCDTPLEGRWQISDSNASLTLYAKSEKAQKVALKVVDATSRVDPATVQVMFENDPRISGSEIVVIEAAPGKNVVLQVNIRDHQRKEKGDTGVTLQVKSPYDVGSRVEQVTHARYLVTLAEHPVGIIGGLVVEARIEGRRTYLRAGDISLGDSMQIFGNREGSTVTCAMDTYCDANTPYVIDKPVVIGRLVLDGNAVVVIDSNNVSIGHVVVDGNSHLIVNQPLNMGDLHVKNGKISGENLELNAWSRLRLEKGAQLAAQEIAIKSNAFVSDGSIVGKRIVVDVGSFSNRGSLSVSGSERLLYTRYRWCPADGCPVEHSLNPIFTVAHCYFEGLMTICRRP